jgi:hypothetical protein
MAVKSLVLYTTLFLFALVPTLLFGVWLRRQSWDLKEKISAWDPFIKVMAIAGAVIVGLATFDRFLDQREQEFLKLEIDRSKAKAGVFGQAIKSASTIANAKSLDGAQEKEAVATFWHLYWGELAQIEGRKVEVAMVQFGRAIQDWQGSGTRPAEIQQLSLGLAHACREEQEPIEKEVAKLRQRYLPSSGIAQP